MQSTIKSRLTLHCALAILGVMGVLALTLVGAVRASHRRCLADALMNEAHLAGEVLRPWLLPGHEQGLSGQVHHLADIVGGRVSVISMEGRVLADSAVETYLLDGGDRKSVV